MAALLEVGREFTFDSAHYLPDYHGSCERMHGHTYRLEVRVRGAAGSDGMVLDFKEIEAAVNQQVLAALDHRLLNDILPQPTAENIAVWIWNRLIDRLPLCEVRLWESPTSFAVYRGENGPDAALV